jgi:Fungal protein kinase
VLGHYYLWLGGVQHNDISVKNLMYDKYNGDRGVLNDYDLAHMKGRSRPSGIERTGTVPFMALDLLAEGATKGHIERLYRHDCESFAWVLLRICCGYDGGKEIRNAPLSELITHDYNDCYKEKFSIHYTVASVTPTASYKRFWPAARELLIWPLSFFLSQAMARGQDKSELEIDKVVEIYRKVLQNEGFDGLI